jgi:hypothetical protein
MVCCADSVLQDDPHVHTPGENQCLQVMCVLSGPVWFLVSGLVTWLRMHPGLGQPHACAAVHGSYCHSRDVY